MPHILSGHSLYEQSNRHVQRAFSAMSLRHNSHCATTTTTSATSFHQKHGSTRLQHEGLSYRIKNDDSSLSQDTTSTCSSLCVWSNDNAPAETRQDHHHDATGERTMNLLDDDDDWGYFVDFQGQKPKGTLRLGMGEPSSPSNKNPV